MVCDDRRHSGLHGRETLENMCSKPLLVVSETIGAEALRQLRELLRVEVGRGRSTRPAVRSGRVWVATELVAGLPVT